MGKKTIELLMLTLFFYNMHSTVHATSISYDLTELGAGQWEYSYTLENNSLFSDIEEFTIYFDYGLYSNLQITSSTTGWDDFVAEPQMILGFAEDGYYDVLTLASGILPGEVLNGFSVQFEWLATGGPGTQYFEIVDADTWDVIDDGYTQLNTQEFTPVPEPGTILFFFTGLCGFIILIRKHSV